MKVRSARRSVTMVEVVRENGGGENSCVSGLVFPAPPSKPHTLPSVQSFNDQLYEEKLNRGDSAAADQSDGADRKMTLAL
ncbi:hypothetical protein J2798_004656 [Herbaspirillum seropedicae]|nr:hypothetical protein [Herbaspirillum seropedicae]